MGYYDEQVKIINKEIADLDWQLEHGTLSQRMQNQLLDRIWVLQYRREQYRDLAIQERREALKAYSTKALCYGGVYTDNKPITLVNGAIGGITL